MHACVHMYISVMADVSVAQHAVRKKGEGEPQVLSSTLLEVQSPLQCHTHTRLAGP